MIERLEENFLAKKRLLHTHIKHTQTHTHRRVRLNIHLYIYSLKDSMGNYSGVFFWFHKLLALRFQAGFDNTISLIGIWYLTLHCPVYVSIFIYRMKAVLVRGTTVMIAGILIMYIYSILSTEL